MSLICKNVDTEVIIIGAGPVGSLLAGILACNGVDVVVVEKEHDVVEAPRAMAVNARTAEILDIFHLREEILQEPPIMQGRYGNKIVDLSDVNTPWPGIWKVKQQTLNKKLIDWAIGAGVHFINDTKIINLYKDRVGNVICGFEGRIKDSKSKVVIGCDGEKSAVRFLANINQEVSQSKQYFVTANVQTSDLPVIRSKTFPTGAMVSTGKIDRNLYRIMMYIPYIKENFSTSTINNVYKWWHEITGSSLNGRVVSWGIQNNRSLLASTFNSSNVVIAGDAAHSQLPTGGSSINYGMEDAFNLAWRIQRFLETKKNNYFNDYSLERNNAARRMQRFVKIQAHELYGDSHDSKLLFGLQKFYPENIANFLSGIDINYESCETGSTSLININKLVDEESKKIFYDSQRKLQYQYINDKKQIINIPDDKFLTNRKTVRVIRPDGYQLWESGQD